MSKKSWFIRMILVLSVIILAIYFIFSYRNNKVGQVNAQKQKETLSKGKDYLNSLDQYAESVDYVDVNGLLEDVSYLVDECLELGGLYEGDSHSISEFTNEVISNDSLNLNTLDDVASYIKDGISLDANSSTEYDVVKIIHLDETKKVSIHYNTTINEKAIKVVLILDNKKVVEIPYNDDSFQYTLPKGDTAVAIIGNQSRGSIQITINNVDGIQYDLDSDW